MARRSVRPCTIGAKTSRDPARSLVLRQNSIHLYFQQLRLPFIQSLFSISKFDLGLELWLPSEQHTGNGLRESGSKCFALAKLTKSVTGRGINCYQYRGAGCQEKKYLAARLGEEFSLDSPFYRTAPFIEH